MKYRRIVSFLLSGLMIFTFVITPSPNKNANAVTSAELSLSDNGVSFICTQEGFRSSCYQDYSQSSIGYGTKCTGSTAQPHAAGSHTITKEAAMSALKKQVNSTYAPRVKSQTAGITMNQNQFDALVSLCYNCGGGTTLIADSPLVKYLKGQLSESKARSQYSNYIITAGGEVLQVLINRRKAEADLFFTKSNETNTVKINYHTNGGTIAANDTYYAKDSMIYNKTKEALAKQTWYYGSGGEDGLINASTFKLSRKGYTFTGWSTSKSGGTVFKQDDTSLTANDIYPDIATKSGTVVMYAQWKKNTLTINYNTNGGTIATNDKYYAKDSMIYNKTKEALAKQTWYYGSGGEDGLINASTFKLSRKGYTFTGWSTSKSGGTVFKQDDTSLTANDIYPDIATKSGTVTMYAQWKENTVTINYNINDGKISIDSKYYVESNGNIYEKEDMTSYAPKWSYTYKPQYGLTDASTFKISREGYTFKGWSTSKSGGKIYDQSNNSLTAIDIFPDITTKSGAVTMYAQWELNLLTMNYNTNGGQISENDTYYAENNGNIYKKSDNTIFSVKWGYSYEAEKGLYNASTFNLSRPGYEFLGWSLSETGGTIYSQSDNTIRAATLFPDIYTKSGKVMLYAQWKKNEIIGDVNMDGNFNVTDVVLLQKWLLGASDITLDDWQAADLCKDDRLDVFDLCLMKRELVKVS